MSNHSSLDIEGLRANFSFKQKKYEQKGTERTTKEQTGTEKIYCISNRDSFLKNKFAVLSDSAEGQNLPGRF